MAIKTVRFNKGEEQLLKKVLKYYRKDFSSCVKELLAEKIEDLRDIGAIHNIKEDKKQNYLSADDIDKLYS